MSAAEDFAESIGARVVMPSKSLLQGKELGEKGYFGGANVTATWDAHREAQRPPAKNVSPIKRKATK